MEYALRRSDTHLEVTVSGVPSIAEVRAMFCDMRDAGYKRALVETRVAVGLDLVATRTGMDELPRLGFPADFRIAILLLDEQGRRSVDFAQELAEHRGLGIRAFSEREPALRWLLA